MNRFYRSCFLAVLASLTISLNANASPASPAGAAAGLQLPQYVGVLELMGERTPRGAHVSRSYSYRSVGLSLDIDVLDFDATQLSAGLDSDVLKQQYEHAKKEARASVAGRAKLLSEAVVQFGAGEQFPAREAKFRLTNPEYEQTNYVWVASVQGRMLELRFSVQEGFEEDGHVSRSEILSLLGEAVVHALRTPEPKNLVASAPQVNVAIVWDPATPAGERQLWMTYLMTRAAHMAQESATQALPLGDQQASFEEEVRARTMALNTFRSLKTQGSQEASSYFSDLDRVEAAGFLREYAWRYLHHASWTATPVDLNLEAFDKWRAAYLTNHVPVTHGRIALRLATK